MTLLGEMFPADPVIIGRMLAPMALRQVRWCRPANGANSSRPSIAPPLPPSIPSTPPASASLKPPAAAWWVRLPWATTARLTWLEAIGQGLRVAAEKRAEAQNLILPAIKGALAQKPIQGRITVSGYEGSELLVARLLIESGADVPYVGTACRARRGQRRIGSGWMRAAPMCNTVPLWNRTSKPYSTCGPTSPSARHLSCRRPRRSQFPRSTSPTDLGAAADGPAGAGSLAQVVMAAIRNKHRFDEMSAFFEGVGSAMPPASGASSRSDRPDFKKKYAGMLAAKAKAEESVGT